MQQVHAPRGRLGLRAAQAARLGVGGVDAPFLIELLGRKGTALAGVREVFAHVKAYAARADHGHALAHGFFVAQHVQVIQYLGVPHAIDGGHAGLDAGGQDDFIKARCRELVRADARV